MADAKRDGNFVPTLLAVSRDDGETPVPVYADPTTHRLLVESTGPGNDGTPTVVLIGDSITSRGNYAVTITALTQTDGIATATASAHALFDGASVCIGNADQEGYNGIKTVISRTASNTFTFAVDADTVSPATGTNLLAVAQQRNSDRNWFELANDQMGHPFRVIYNTGISGQTLAEIEERFIRDAVNYAPTMIQIQGGINDIQATTAGQESTVLATMQDNILSMVTTCIQRGIVPLLVTCMPLDSSASTYTTARGQMVLRFNDYLRQLAYYQYPEIILFDAWATVVSPTDATGDWKANYVASDGLHPTALGCQEMGQSLATVLSNYGYTARVLVGSIFDSYDNDSANPQIDPNPLNQGTGGTLAGGATGTVPDSYTATKTGAGATAVMSIAARSDGFGNDLVCTFTSTATNDAIDIVQTSQLHSRTSPGDVLMASSNLSVTGITNMSNISYAFEWAYTNGSGSHTITQPATLGSAASGQLTDDLNFTLYCPPFTIPSGGATGLKTRVKMTFAGAGGAVLKWGRHSIVKVTATPTYQ